MKVRIERMVIDGFACDNPSCRDGNCVPACGCRCHEEVVIYKCGCIITYNPQFMEPRRGSDLCGYHFCEEMEEPSKEARKKFEAKFMKEETPRVW